MITSQPADATVAEGSVAQFSVSRTGSGTLHYQWLKNGANIIGEIRSTYTTSATTAADSGSLFSVTVTDDFSSVLSRSATLTVTSVQAPSIVTQPTNKTVRTGQTAKFSVTVSGSNPISYQWRKNGIDISGATSSVYLTPPVTTDDNGSLFSVVATNVAGSVTSANATLTVR